MANAEENPIADIVLRGVDGNECEAFIAAIRDRAFAQGMDEGDPWMLRFATSRLRGRAMRWHAKLDLTVQKSWHLFVQALFEEYTFVEEQDEVGMATPVWTSTTFSPSPSATTSPRNNRRLATTKPASNEAISHEMAEPSGSLPLHTELAPPRRVYDSSLPGYHVGHLLLIYDEGRPGPHYISTSKRATSNIREALIVTFVPSSEPHYIGCFNHEKKKLGVNLCSPEHSELHDLVGSYYSEEAISMSRSGSQAIYEIWNISQDGTLKATLPDLVLNEMQNRYIPSELYSTTRVFVEISGRPASFAKEYSTPRAKHPGSNLPIVRARIVFEPL